MGRLSGLLAAILAVLAGDPSRGAIVGDIVRVGYLATSGEHDLSSPTTSVVRIGSWTPVVVDLTLQNQTAFDGMLRLRQFDRDGDIYVDSVPVHLAETGAGARQRYWLYTVANPQNMREHNFAVELLASPDGDEESARLVQVISGGMPVPAMLSPIRPEILSDNHFLTLSIGDGGMGKVRVVARDPEIADRYDRPMSVAHGSPSDLPSRWVGLDAVDAIVWDEADTTRITPEQERALVEWVRQGGRLVLSAGRTASAVAQSSVIGPLLPVRVGPVHAATELPDVRRNLLGITGETSAAYSKPVTAAACTLVDEPGVEAIITDEALGGVVVSSRRIGRGKIVFVAASLGELLADSAADPVRCYRWLLGLRGNPIGDATTNSSYVLPLYRYLDREVGFYQTGAMRLALALFFAVGYVLVATLAVWKLLAGRNLLKHSWSALAVTALVASVLSLIGVQTLRGVGWDVQQVTVVDCAAGRSSAVATAYFGVKTGVHSRLDLWLPRDYRLDQEPSQTACMLKPMMDWQDHLEAGATYTDPTRYWLSPSTAEIFDAPIRGTSKQFEGYWQGDMSGTLLASIATDDIPMPRAANDPELVNEYAVTEDSWIQNELGVDLSECYLLVAERDVYGAENYLHISPRDMQIQVFAIGAVAAGDRVRLHDAIYYDQAGKLLSSDRRRQFRLQSVQRRWGDPFVSRMNMPGMADEDAPMPYRLEHYQFAVLLMTVLGDVDPAAYGTAAWGGVQLFPRTRMRRLDVSSLLRRDTALLVGFSEEPGPVRLCMGTNSAYEAVTPVRARTVYRIQIPVTVR